jgi:hypothetical protein
MVSQNPRVVASVCSVTQINTPNTYVCSLQKSGWVIHTYYVNQGDNNFFPSFSLKNDLLNYWIELAFKRPFFVPFKIWVSVLDKTAQKFASGSLQMDRTGKYFFSTASDKQVSTNLHTHKCTYMGETYKLQVCNLQISSM